MPYFVQVWEGDLGHISRHVNERFYPVSNEIAYDSKLLCLFVMENAGVNLSYQLVMAEGIEQCNGGEYVVPIPINERNSVPKEDDNLKAGDPRRK